MTRLDHPSFLGRFWAKVDKSGPLPTAAPHLGPCWLWTASLNGSGYGQIKGPLRAPVLAHRASYELHGGELVDGMELDHLCSVRRCVNPDHLESVTHRENLIRGNGPTGIASRQTHCVHGHEFTEENTYVPPRGGRQCRECGRRRCKEQYARRMEAAT